MSIPLSLTVSPPGALKAGSFSLSGCSVNPISIPGDGATYDISADPSCEIAISYQNAPSSDTRYGFDTSGSFSTNTSIISCSSGNCPEEFVNYYFQVEENFNYTLIGGGSFFLPPRLEYEIFGSLAGATLSKTMTPYWMDSQTSWSATNPLQVVSSETNSSHERWISPIAQGTLQFVNQSTTISYYHQYFVSNPSFTALEYIEFGSSVATSSSAWVDSGSKLKVNAESQGSFVRDYAVGGPLYVYIVPNGIQLVTNSSASSINWDTRDYVLSFNLTKSLVEAYVDPSLGITLQRIFDNGSLVTNYLQSQGLVSFNASSPIEMIFSVSATSNSTIPSSSTTSTTSTNSTELGGNSVSLVAPDIYMLPGTLGNATLEIFNQQDAYVTLNSLSYDSSNFTFSSPGAFFPLTVVPNGVGHIEILVGASLAKSGNYTVTGYADFKEFKNPLVFTLHITVLGDPSSTPPSGGGNTGSSSYEDGLTLVFALGVIGIVAFLRRRGATF